MPAEGVQTPGDVARIVWTAHSPCGCAWLVEGDLSKGEQVAFCPEHVKQLRGGGSESTDV